MRWNQVRSFICGAALAAGLIAASGPVTAASTVAGAKFGNEFIASATTQNHQRNPSVGMDAVGNFAVLFRDFSMPANDRMLVQRYDAVGRKLGAEIVVGEPGGFSTEHISMAANGDFLVWIDRFVHLFNADGSRKRSPINLSEQLAADYPGPNEVFDIGASVALPQSIVPMDADGGFAFAFRVRHENQADIAFGKPQDVRVRRFNADGTRKGPDIVVFPLATSFYKGLDPITMAPDGQIVLAVQDFTNVQSGSSPTHMRFRRVRTDGSLGNIVTIDTDKPELDEFHNANASDAVMLLAADGTGAFTVSWILSPINSGSSKQIRFYDSADAPLGPRSHVGGSFGACSRPSQDLVRAPTGDTVVSCFDGSNLLYQRYNNQGQALDAGLVQVNGPIPAGHGSQGGDLGSGFAMDADGDFVAVWKDVGESEDDVRGQRFVGRENVDLSLGMEDSQDPVATGGSYSYRYRVSNLHPQVAPIPGSSAGILALNRAIGSTHDVRVSSPQAGNVTLGAGSGSDWNCTRSGNTVNCNYLGVILGAAQASLLEIAATAPSSGATVEQSGVVDIAYQPDSNQPNNSDCEATLVGTGSAPSGCGSAGPVTVNFEAATSEKTEPTTSATSAHSITVRLSRAASSPVSVPFTISGTATNSGDYNSVSASPLTFATGATTATLSLSVSGDEVAEPNETVIFTLGTPSGAALGSPSAHTLTIRDMAPPSNNPPSFTSTPVTTATVGTPYTYNITVTDADAGDTLTVIGGPLPNGLALSNAANGPRTARLSGTPVCGAQSGSISLQVSDGKGGTATQTFQLTINNSSSCQNPAPASCNSGNTPSFTSNAPVSVNINQPLAYTVRVNSPDGSALTLTAPTLPSCLRLLEGSAGPNTRSLDGIVDVGCVASGLNVALTVTDAKGCSATQNFNLATVGTDIETLTDAVGQVVQLVADAGSLENVQRLSASQQSAMTVPAGVRLVNGLYQFTLRNVPVGGTAKVAVKFTGAADRYVKCSGTNCTTFANATVANGLAVLTLRDGGPGDADGVANGVIADPGGPAAADSGAGAGDGSTPADGNGGGTITIIEERPPNVPGSAGVDGEDEGGGATSPLLLLALLLMRGVTARRRLEAL